MEANGCGEHRHRPHALRRLRGGVRRAPTPRHLPRQARAASRARRTMATATRPRPTAARCRSSARRPIVGAVGNVNPSGRACVSGDCATAASCYSPRITCAGACVDQRATRATVGAGASAARARPASGRLPVPNGPVGVRRRLHQPDDRRSPTAAVAALRAPRVRRAWWDMPVPLGPDGLRRRCVNTASDDAHCGAWTAGPAQRNGARV